MLLLLLGSLDDFVLFEDFVRHCRGISPGAARLKAIAQVQKLLRMVLMLRVGMVMRVVRIVGCSGQGVDAVVVVMMVWSTYD